MTDGNDKPPRRQKKERNMQRVNELYRIADEIYGGLEEPAGPAFIPAKPAKEAAGKRHADSKDDTGAAEGKSDHAWIVHVLTDLAEYAHDRQLESVEACLTETRLKVIEILEAEGHADD